MYNRRKEASGLWRGRRKPVRRGAIVWYDDVKLRVLVCLAGGGTDLGPALRVSVCSSRARVVVFRATVCVAVVVVHVC